MELLFMRGMVGEGAAHWGGSPLRQPSPENLIYIGRNCNTSRKRI